MKPGQFRFLLALLVLVQHSFPLHLGNMAVFVFFMLSGYWIARLWTEKYCRLENPRAVFLVSRWWRLFPVFLLCSLLGWATLALLPAAGPRPREIMPWLLRQLPVAGSLGEVPVLVPAWSLDVEMQFYLFAACALAWLLAPGRARTTAVLLLALAGMAVGLGFVAAGGSLIEPCLPLWISYFLAGVLIQRTGFRAGSQLARGSGLLFLAVLAVAAATPALRAVVWQSGQARPDDGTLAAVVTFLSPLLLVPLVAYNVHQPSDRLDRWLGNWAYPLYLFHWIPRLFYYQHTDWSRPWWTNAALLAANFAVALAGSALILVFVDRPLERARAHWIARCPDSSSRPVSAAKPVPAGLSQQA